MIVQQYKMQFIICQPEGYGIIWIPYIVFNGFICYGGTTPMFLLEVYFLTGTETRQLFFSYVCNAKKIKDFVLSYLKWNNC